MRPVKGERVAERPLSLVVLPGLYAVCRLSPGEMMAETALKGDFVSVTRTRDEVSVVCLEGQAPEGAKVEAGWRCLQVQGPLDFALTGVLASLAAPLARAGISIFAVSTYNTDYLLVKAEALERAVAALEAAAHRVESA
jgi:hypothetical protein